MAPARYTTPVARRIDARDGLVDISVSPCNHSRRSKLCYARKFFIVNIKMLTPEQLQSVKSTLFSGQYNLLLGSGVSLDAFDVRGKKLKSASDLAVELCELKGVKTGTPLARISLLLDSNEVEKYLTIPYTNCKAGDTAKLITSFVWRSAFTFNIDDVLEAAYSSVTRPKQEAVSLNYDSTYQTSDNKSKLQIIHLHGYTAESEKGYVFSTSEYGRATRGMNPWMHVLAELISSEPFIISGTSLNEPDLEYYLKDRTETSARSNRGPSFFVEPYPDKITENLCSRHGLILIKAKLGEFLQWLGASLGHAPSVTQLTIPSVSGIFSKPLPPSDQVDFFSSFELLRPTTKNPEGEVSPFHFGRSIRWTDLETNLDIPTSDGQKFFSHAKNFLAEHQESIKIMCTLGDPGSGKTTQIRRAAYDLAKEGYLVVNLLEKAVLDTKNISKILESVNQPVAMIIDGLAEHAPSLRKIILNIKPKKPVVVLGADRDYRFDHIDRVLGDLDITYFNITKWPLLAYEQLIDALRKAGLAGVREAVYYPKQLAQQLLGDVVAIATCRTLNDFRPLEKIVRSVWSDGAHDARRSYAIAALAEYCYRGGVSYPVLQAAQSNPRLKEQLEFDCPLPLTFTDDGDYVLPLQAVIAERLLNMLSREKQTLLLELFCALATALSPYVNRRTTIARTPEARLAARLFSADKVVRPLLGDHAADFYSKTRPAWQWNARYWEQRAILTQSENIETAIQYARHAVAIEAHPFPWTTLASLLSRKLENLSNGLALIFDEIYELLFQIFRHEANSKSWRPTPHPYVILFKATKIYLEKGGKLPPKKQDWIKGQIAKAQDLFKRDVNLLEMANSIRPQIS